MSDDGADEEDTLHPLKPSMTPAKVTSVLMTPDKPVTYCVDGTPVCLSRFYSITFLASGGIYSSKGR